MEVKTDYEISRIELESSFHFPKNDEVTDAMAPLITAKRSSDSSSILIRAIVFVPTGSTDVFLGEPTVINDIVTYFVTFNKVGTLFYGFEMYYLETHYTKNVERIDQVAFFLHDDDPRTSRGTVTTVQTS